MSSFAALKKNSKSQFDKLITEVSKLNAMAKLAKQEHVVNIDDFKKLDIGMGEVVEVEDLEGSDKLYKLKVNDGELVRQIVAGLKESISKQDLLGKQVLILKNLEKAVIRGVESQGMILALKEGKHTKALTFEGFKLGAKLS